MTTGSRGSALLKNYISVAGGFAALAALTLLTKTFIDSEAYSYLSGVGLLGLACILLKMLRIKVLRGFLPYIFSFALCAAVFPASDAFGDTFPDFTLYAGFIGMLIVMAAVLWRAATYTGEAARRAEKI